MFGDSKEASVAGMECAGESIGGDEVRKVAGSRPHRTLSAITVALGFTVSEMGHFGEL